MYPGRPHGAGFNLFNLVFWAFLNNIKYVSNKDQDKGYDDYNYFKQHGFHFSNLTQVYSLIVYLSYRDFTK